MHVIHALLIVNSLKMKTKYLCTPTNFSRTLPSFIPTVFVDMQLDPRANRFRAKFPWKCNLTLERGCSMFCFPVEYENKDGGRDEEEKHNFYAFNS